MAYTIMYKTNFDGKHSYSTAEIQALLWTAQDFSDETKQNAMQKLTQR